MEAADHQTNQLETATTNPAHFRHYARLDHAADMYGCSIYTHSPRCGADGYQSAVQRSFLLGTLDSQGEEATILRSYVLIQTAAGRAIDVAGAIRGESGVISTEAVTGPYDVVVLVEAEEMDAVGQLVRTAIQPVEGIVRTLTCPVVNL